MRTWRPFLFFAALACSLLGCAVEDGTPLQPSAGGAPGPVAEASNDYVVVSPSGGVVSGGGAVLVVPAGALEAETAIRIRTSLENGTQSWTVEPAGLHFGVCCALTLPLTEPDGLSSAYHVLEWDPSSGVWSDKGGSVGSTGISVPLIDPTRYQIDIIN